LQWHKNGILVELKQLVQLLGLVDEQFWQTGLQGTHDPLTFEKVLFVQLETQLKVGLL